MQISIIDSSFNLNYRSGARTPGVHLSGILKVIARMMGYISDDDDDAGGRIYPGLPNHVINKAAMGLAWEEWIGPQIDGMYYHPGEITRDGIVMSPDGVWIDTDGTGTGSRVHEFKCTWKSVGKTESMWPKQWLWIAQMKGYCYAFETTVAWLHVMYVNGDYRGSGPVYRMYQFEFTSQEIASHWGLILKYKDQAQPEGAEEESEAQE